MACLNSIKIFKDKSVGFYHKAGYFAIDAQDSDFFFKAWEEMFGKKEEAPVKLFKNEGEFGDFEYELSWDDNGVVFSLQWAGEEYNEEPLVMYKDEMIELRDMLNYFLSEKKIEDDIKELEKRLEFLRKSKG